MSGPHHGFPHGHHSHGRRMWGPWGWPFSDDDPYANRVMSVPVDSDLPPYPNNAHLVVFIDMAGRVVDAGIFSEPHPSRPLSASWAKSRCLYVVRRSSYGDAVRALAEGVVVLGKDHPVFAKLARLPRLAHQITEQLAPSMPSEVSAPASVGIDFSYSPMHLTSNLNRRLPRLW